MKRAERHHLKQNPFATWVADVTEAAATHGRQITYGLVVLVVVAALVAGYFYWRARISGEADAALAAALTIAEAPVIAPAAPGTTDTATPPPAPQPGSYPTRTARLEAALPAFLAVAASYPGSDAATTALYHAGATLAAVGRLDEAASRYQQVVERDRGGLYGQMAELGLANVHVLQGQPDRAIAIYQSLSSAADTRLPIDAVLLQLGRAFVKAGQPEEAARVYRRIVDEFPESLFLADATNALAEMEASRQS